MSENIFTIILDNGNKYYDFGYETNPNTKEKSKYIVVVTDKDDDYEEIINDKNTFENRKKDFEVNFTYEEFFNNPYNLEINGNKEDVIHFLNNNKINNTRIIIGSIKGEISINDEDYIDLLNKNLKNKDNIYLKLEGNSYGINIDDCKYTIDYINNIVKKIKEKNLSPFEELIYLYDIVRDRYYIGENEEKEDASISRDLTEVIKGEKIVCLGFSEIFDKISKKLGFSSKIQYLHNKEITNGHARNMVYIKDEKYNIDGIFVFDPTYGCKRDETNNHFNSYLLCGRPNEFFEFLDEKIKNGFIDDEIEILKYIYNKVINDDFDIEIMKKLIISKTYRSLLNKEINTKKPEEFKEKIIELYNLLNKRISKESYLEALTKVRIKEYYENEEKFPLSIEKIIELSPSIIEPQEEINKKINRIRLSKTLRKVINKNNLQNPQNMI